MSWRVTHTYDFCPRCKSWQVEVADAVHRQNRWVVEYLHCNNCGLDFEQHYQYVRTTGGWEDADD